MKDDVIFHYDKLIEENNDPVKDPQPLKEYMDKWDGPVFIDRLQLDSGKSVLETGIGTGRLAVRVAPHCRDFTGIDFSPKTIARAKTHLACNNNVTLICGDFNTYDFDQPFDVIYSSLTFMHIEDKRQTIDKVHTLLRAGGRFVLSIDKNQDRCIDLGTRKIMVYPDNPADTERDLKQAGFAVVEVIETELAHIFVAEK